MSVDFYVNRKDIRFDELLPRLERHDITLAWSKNERAMLLSDNRNGGSCWVYAGEDGMLCGATIYAERRREPHRCGDWQRVRRAGRYLRLRRAASRCRHAGGCAEARRAARPDELPFRPATLRGPKQ